MNTMMDKYVSRAIKTLDLLYKEGELSANEKYTARQYIASLKDLMEFDYSEYQSTLDNAKKEMERMHTELMERLAQAKEAGCESKQAQIKHQADKMSEMIKDTGLITWYVEGMDTI